MFERELIILIVQIIAALGVVVSVVYLGVQINQQNKIKYLFIIILIILLSHAVFI